MGSGFEYSAKSAKDVRKQRTLQPFEHGYYMPAVRCGVSVIWDHLHLNPPVVSLYPGKTSWHSTPSSYMGGSIVEFGNEA
jgi:hypothetical protein